MAGLVGQTGFFTRRPPVAGTGFAGRRPAIAQPAHSLGALPPNSGECAEGQAQMAGREKALRPDAALQDDGVTDGMDASPYTGPAAGSFRREFSLEPDGIKVPKWKFTHAKDKEDSSWRLQPMDWIWQSRSCSCTG